ncbi:tyrosinase [Apiospora marii]|uniref:tyrosinase n=1 Tax=Apiospora marii TaxID=335849 RepID=UPI0031300536
MKFSQVAGLAALANGVIGATAVQSRDYDLSTAEHEFKKLVASIEENASAELSKHDKSAGCTAENIIYRQEFGDLSKDQRLDYTQAVLCLMSLPANTPSDYAPGAKSRYDDFIITHINHTLDAHYTGNFMAWHRWFIYTYETALRDECGYNGYQPYWDWPKYASAPQDSPIFNGDPYSMGGNGEWDPDLPPSVVGPPEGVPGVHSTLPRGLGGGFVTTGPFANMTINVGPIALASNNSPPNPQADGLGYNPRPLKRDVGPAVNERFANWTTVWDRERGKLRAEHRPVFSECLADLYPCDKQELLNKPNITEYRFLSEGGFDNGEIGPHGGGHYTIKQAMDPENRNMQLDEGPYGHITWNNDPVSRLTTLDDVINIGWAGPETTMREMMSTTGGTLCYFYK